MIGTGSTLNQRFTLGKELGRGGMGAVFRATDLVLGRSVAIKTLQDSSGEEYARKIRLEAQILARLLHDNVVRLYDFGAAESIYFLVMEEVDGTSFSKRWRHLPLAERLRVNAQVADALHYAHQQGVIHRDVKPANVLLTATDQAKLSDFGLSTLTDSGDESGAIRGTPHYMSPEQSRGKRLDHRSDLYSLGVMLYECATGSVPFTGSSSMAVIAQHVSATPETPRERNPDLAPSLEALILSLLDKDPARRPATGELVARSIRDEIEAVRRHHGGKTTALIGTPEATEGGPAPGGAPTTARAPLTHPATGTGTGPPPTEGTAAGSGSSSGSRPAFGSGSGSGQRAAQPSVSASVSKVSSPLARTLLGAVLSEPVTLSADERYYCGHYLAYLLGGARRKGLFLTRPFDPRNADRARLLLAMTWLFQAGVTDETVKTAAELLDGGADVRPALNPVVVVKYLA